MWFLCFANMHLNWLKKAWEQQNFIAKSVVTNRDTYFAAKTQNPLENIFLVKNKNITIKILGGNIELLQQKGVK